MPSLSSQSEGAEDKATGPTGYGWIRNAYAIDDDGGIYVASQQHMHKVVWNGSSLLISMLGRDTSYQPYGVQKFAWGSVSRSLFLFLTGNIV